MKNFLPSSTVIFASVALLQVGLLRAEGTAPILLRYGFKPGQTNAYKLEIESQGESGREAIAGTFTISSRSIGSNLTELTFQGRLQPKNIPGAMPRMGFFGSGNGSSLSSFGWMTQFPGEAKELVIDDRGTVMRDAGDQALPIPLGQLMESFVEKFPAEPATEWQQEQDVFVLDEPLFQGPANAFLSPNRFQPMYFNPNQRGHGAQGVLTARQETKTRVTDETPQTVSFEKTLSLDTYLLTGTEPRISAKGRGKYIFDRIAGCPKRVETECTTVAVTEDLSRRSVLTLRWEMLEGAERDAALAPPPPVPAEKSIMPPEQVSKLVEQMKSDDMGTRQIAARELSTGHLDTAGPEMLSAMTTLAEDPDETVRHAALTILANYGTAEQVPVLINGLHDSAPGISATILHALGRLKDPRAAMPLADYLGSGQNDQQYYQTPRANDAAEALVKIGPASEAPVLALLKEKNIEVRAQACLVLRRIGTRKSFAALKELTAYPNKELSEAAAAACQSIQDRQKIN